MVKPKDIFEIEKILKIELTPYNGESDITNYENRNTYKVNANNEVIGLNLIGNKITEISFLENLKYLTHLNLANNKISEIIVLENFLQLKNLDLNHNLIKDLSPIKNLTQLTNLNLWNNEIKEIYYLEKLDKLINLDLSYNQISDISILKNKLKISELILFQNNISNISSISELKDIEILNLGDNHISDITPLKKLKKIISLNLSYNRIYDISILKFLKNIEFLYLDSNFISSILPIKDLQNLTDINLNNNPIEGTTLSDFSDIDGVKGYLESLQDKSLLVENYSIKINILGTGRIGKTQLFRWLNGEKFVDKDSITHGTGVSIYNVNKTKYNASLWDFGGQSYQHGTHSLFLRPTDFYLIIFRSVNDNYGYGYWVGASRNFSIKKADNKYNNPLFLIQSVWSIDNDKEVYPNSKKIETYQIEPNSIFSIDINQFSKNNKEWKIRKDYFINSFNNRIIHYAKSFGKIPKEFVKIKDKIENNPFDIYILKKDFKTEFAPQYSKTEFAYLLQYLEFTGCIIYFKEKSLLEEYVFTNPKALSDWIYKTVLDKKFQKENHGILSFEKLIQDFGEDKAFVFRELMTDFNLIFEEPQFNKDIISSSGKETINLVIPQFLPENNSSFKKVLLNLIPFTFSIKFEDFIYEGRIFNFISQYGEYSEDNSSYWKYGILFRKDEIQSIVYYDIEKRIINVHLENKKESVNLGREILNFFILKQPVEDYSNKYRVSKFLRDYKIKYEDFNNAFKNKTGYSLTINSKIPLEFEDYLIDYFDGYESVNKNNESLNITEFSEELKKTLSKILSEPRKIDPKDVIIGSQISTNNTNYLDVIETLQTNEETLSGYCVTAKKNIPLDFLTIQLLNMNNQKLPKIFISYSRKDLKYKNILKSHLSILEQYDLIKAWSCDEMVSGKWNKQIQQQLEDSDIIIYMVSHNFMDSSYIMDQEVKKGIQLIENDPNKKIICVLVGVCQWQNWPIIESKFQEKGNSANFLSKDLSQFQFLPYHQYKDNMGIAVREEIVPLEKWGRYPYDVENEAYNQIVSRVLNEIKI